jgi:hypothetical protein
MFESNPQSFGKLKSILTSLHHSIFDKFGDWWQKYLVIAHHWALSEKRKKLEFAILYSNECLI